MYVNLFSNTASIVLNTVKNDFIISNKSFDGIIIIRRNVFLGKIQKCEHMSFEQK